MIQIRKLPASCRGAMRVLRSVSLGVPAVPIVSVLATHGPGATPLLRKATEPVETAAREVAFAVQLQAISLNHHTGGRRLARLPRRGRLGRPGSALAPPRASVTVLKSYSCPVSMDHCYHAAPSASPALCCSVLCAPQRPLPAGVLPMQPAVTEKPEARSAGDHVPQRQRQGAPAGSPRRPGQPSRWPGQRDRPGE
jgi:hypothetical protein